MSEYRVVVSAENNPFMAWQCKLFHFSCVSRLRLTPTFIVHESGKDWHPDFRDIVRAGGIVRHAPSYALTPQGQRYSPRNTPGTLLHAAELYRGTDDLIVLCDPDMLFVNEPKFPRMLSGEYYPYMRYDQEAVQTARQKLGVAACEIESRGSELCLGVPHVVPSADAQRLAETWLEAIDAFPPVLWEISMYALGLAAVKLKMRIELTYMLGFSHRMDAPIVWDMIHYCYGDERWSKHHFHYDEQARAVWKPQVDAPGGTVLGEILAQLREAGEFYGRFTF
ncbi:MAG TPA: hypothetical protein VGB76_12095 [Pyrinomonadaceae bacterium]|jgi:hypothetical protein